MSVRLKRNAISNILLEALDLYRDLIVTGLQKGDDVLTGRIGFCPVDRAGTCFGDGYLSILDHGAGWICNCAGDGSTKLLCACATWGAQRNKPEANGGNQQVPEGAAIAGSGFGDDVHFENLALANHLKRLRQRWSELLLMLRLASWRR
jgi:hypothetical protein